MVNNIMEYMNKLYLFMGIEGYLPKELNGANFDYIFSNFGKFIKDVEKTIKIVVPFFDRREVKNAIYFERSENYDEESFMETEGKKYYILYHRLENHAISFMIKKDNETEKYNFFMFNTGLRSDNHGFGGKI
jgi:hypothetical protein